MDQTRSNQPDLDIVLRASQAEAVRTAYIGGNALPLNKTDQNRYFSAFAFRNRVRYGYFEPAAPGIPKLSQRLDIADNFGGSNSAHAAQIAQKFIGQGFENVLISVLQQLHLPLFFALFVKGGLACLIPAPEHQQQSFLIGSFSFDHATSLRDETTCIALTKLGLGTVPQARSIADSIPKGNYSAPYLAEVLATKAYLRKAGGLEFTI